MIEILMPVRSFMKNSRFCIDNVVFRLHYRVTVTMLLVFCVIITSKQFFGEPMQCKGNLESIGLTYVNTYCWNYGTYTLKSALKGTQGKHFPYPGVGNPKGEEDVVHHVYYQWVCFVLCGQACMFYIPRFLWRSWEGGLLPALAKDLDMPIPPPEWEDTRRELVEYLTRGNPCCHMLYVMRYCFCEILNLVNVVGQIFLLNIFLGGGFSDYGRAVASFNSHIPLNTKDFDLDNISPMDKYFPKMTACKFYQYGDSGTIVNQDFLCILTLNILNEKIFVLLWFWLIFLTFISGLSVIFRVLTFCLIPLRMLLTLGQLRFAKYRMACKIVRRFSFGDWYVLYLLGKNMNTFLFKELMLELCKEINRKDIMV